MKPTEVKGIRKKPNFLMVGQNADYRQDYRALIDALSENEGWKDSDNYLETMRIHLVSSLKMSPSGTERLF
jgi:hypothetical protein